MRYIRREPAKGGKLFGMKELAVSFFKLFFRCFFLGNIVRNANHSYRYVLFVQDDLPFTVYIPDRSIAAKDPVIHLVWIACAESVLDRVKYMFPVFRMKERNINFVCNNITFG